MNNNVIDFPARVAHLPKTLFQPDVKTSVWNKGDYVEWTSRNGNIIRGLVGEIRARENGADVCFIMCEDGIYRPVGAEVLRFVPGPGAA